MEFPYKKIVEDLSRKFGEPITGSVQDAYSFPSCKRLAETSLEELALLGQVIGISIYIRQQGKYV